jgi:hypothetical protein
VSPPRPSPECHFQLFLLRPARPPAQGSGAFEDSREDRATPSKGGPRGPPQVQPTPLGSPSLPSLHNLPSCSLRLSASLFGHRRRQLHSLSYPFSSFPPSRLRPRPIPPRIGRPIAQRTAQAPTLQPRAGGAGGGEAEAMATRSLTSA